MFSGELDAKIARLEVELATKEEEYVNAIKTHKDYKTVRALRDAIAYLKTALQTLQNQ